MPEKILASDCSRQILFHQFSEFGQEYLEAIKVLHKRAPTTELYFMAVVITGARGEGAVTGPGCWAICLQNLSLFDVIFLCLKTLCNSLCSVRY